jgi:hypothetical protein
MFSAPALLFISAPQPGPSGGIITTVAVNRIQITDPRWQRARWRGGALLEMLDVEGASRTPNLLI